MTGLPRFKYHLDPIATGSVVPSEAVCRACGSSRGFIYVGPVYSTEELDSEICPWCIADGSAHEKFEAEFVDPASVGGHLDWPEVSAAIVEEVACRTPGFTGWQQERWFTCCEDAGEFLGTAGRKELVGDWVSAIAEIRKETGLSDIEWHRYLDALDKSAGPTAYVFRCRHCARLGGYSDNH